MDSADSNHSLDSRHSNMNLNPTSVQGVVNDFVNFQTLFRTENGRKVREGIFIYEISAFI